jgi:VIT1/CCC1 family predicted Fe2+/Mn2+ transporter
MTAEMFPAEDKRYLAQLVASETGLSQQEAEGRVDTVLQGLADAKAEAQAAAEEAREAAITLSVVAFVSLLVGAFIGSVAAALGGRHRDDLDAVLAS